MCRDWLHSLLAKGLYKNVHFPHADSSTRVAFLHDIGLQRACTFLVPYGFFFSLAAFLPTPVIIIAQFVSDMTNSKTGSGVRNSDCFDELISVLAGMPVRYSTRSHARAFFSLPVRVKIRI